MEYRIADYIISGQTITLPRKTGIEDIRLIYNETQKVLICSTSKKSNLGNIVVNAATGKTLIDVPSSVCVLNNTDKLTIKCDYGDNLLEIENKVNDGISTLSNKIDNIDLSSVENKVDEGVATLSDKIDNIDLSSVEAKVESEADSIEAKIDEIVAAYNNGQNIIDQMVAIQLQTIIGGEE